MYNHHSTFNMFSTLGKREVEMKMEEGGRGKRETYIIVDRISSTAFHPYRLMLMRSSAIPNIYEE
jgi:hypothetical protein